MILVTGGTGFIGRAVVRQLALAGHSIRLLIRPSPQSPRVPQGLPVEIAVSSINDERGVSSAMVGVSTVYHLAGVERRGAYGDLVAVDIHGTRLICQAAQQAGIKRIFFLSHLGVQRSSAYPVAKAKAIAEEIIRKSGLDYTIFRTGIVFGEGDGFTTGLARLLHTIPSTFLVPGDGKALMHPLWVEDLATCLSWALEDVDTTRQTYEIGGPEHLTFLNILNLVMETLGIQRHLWYIRPPYLRGLTVLLESIFPGLPVSVFWLDYLAENHTCALDTIPRSFNLMPSRLSHRIDYLKNQNWRISLLKTMLQRRIS